MTLPAITEWSFQQQLETGYAVEIDGKPHIITIDSDTGATVLKRVTIVDQPTDRSQPHDHSR